MNHARIGRTQEQNHLRDVFPPKATAENPLPAWRGDSPGIRLLAILLEQLRRERGPARLVVRAQAFAGISVEILVKL